MIGWLDRDIKPGNILVSADGTCKIADFGTAILTEYGIVPASDVRGTPGGWLCALESQCLTGARGYGTCVTAPHA